MLTREQRLQLLLWLRPQGLTDKMQEELEKLLKEFPQYAR
jgi:hypothetical protein